MSPLEFTPHRTIKTKTTLLNEEQIKISIEDANNASNNGALLKGDTEICKSNTKPKKSI